MRRFIRISFFINISLFGGLCFAAAPVATLNLASNSVQLQPTGSNVLTPNSNAPASAPIPAQPVVNSAAILSSMTPEQRIARLENQVQYLSTYNSQIQSLSTQVDVLRGQVEDLNYQVKLLKKQLAAATPVAPTGDTVPSDMTAASNTAAAPASTTTTATAPVTTTANTTTPTPAAVSPAEQTAFNQAYALLTKEQYTQATTAFNNFLKTYPKSTLAPDAHYWLGDLYLASGQPDNASQQYKIVANNKTADKRPDAMVKLGTILLAYGDNANAKQLFQQVVKQYPNTPAATQATTRLKTIASSS